VKDDDAMPLKAAYVIGYADGTAVLRPTARDLQSIDRVERIRAHYFGPIARAQRSPFLAEKRTRMNT